MTPITSRVRQDAANLAPPARLTSGVTASRPVLARLGRLLAPAGAACAVAGAAFGGYWYVAHPPPADATAPAPSVRAESAPRCNGSDPVPGVSGAVCKRPVAVAPKALRP